MAGDVLDGLRLVENLLRAVAMMNVKINHRYPPETVLRLCVAGNDRSMVKEAKAHGSRSLGVVAGRANGAKRIGGLAGHDLIKRKAGGTTAAQRGCQGIGTQHRVPVEFNQSLCRLSRLELSQPLFGVNAANLLACGQRGRQQIDSLQIFQCPQNRPLARRSLRAFLAGIMPKAIIVMDYGGGHDWIVAQERRMGGGQHNAIFSTIAAIPCLGPTLLTGLVLLKSTTGA